MKVDALGQPYFTSQDLISALYLGKEREISNVRIATADSDYLRYLEFVEVNKLDDWPLPLPYEESNLGEQEFDQSLQNRWFMPDEYKNLDIEAFILSLCKTPNEIQRVDIELELFRKHDMINVLKYLKFLVDKMRVNNVVWGVGRGSSVASYSLYLLGVHKINSLKYNLDISEFLK